MEGLAEHKLGGVMEDHKEIDLGSNNNMDHESINNSAVPTSTVSDTSGTVVNDNASEPLDGGENGGAGTKLRKRTKTGCLTCRKRRIKCGEERPICSNCIKSKRHCEGYNQRIVFKSSNGWTMTGGPPSYPIPYHTSAMPGGPGGPQGSIYFDVQPHYGIPIDEHGRPIPIPRPPQAGEYSSPSGQYQLPPFSPIPPEHSSAPAPHMAPHEPYRSHHSRFEEPHTAHYGEQHSFQQQNPNSNHYQLPHRPSPPPNSHESRNLPRLQPPSGPNFPERREDPAPNTGDLPHSVQLERPYGSLHGTSTGYSESSPNVYVDPISKPGISRNFQGPRLSIPATPLSDRPLGSAEVNHGPLDLDKAAVEFYYDNSNLPGYFDEELDIELSPQEAHNRFEGELSMIHDIYNNNAGEGMTRDYKNFLHSGILKHYDAEKVAHPLKNSHTARVFMHFLTATALSISIHERKPQHPSADFFFDNQPRDPSQGLWTYVLPMMALSHQGLLHAMLSLSSLQVAKLQNTSPTPAYKHYAYAIKRIHGCVGNPRKRSLPSTLAATLLLAFYEVMTADHQKWCSHLSGAAQLVSEIDFRRMASMARAQQMDLVAHESITSDDGSAGYENPAILDDDLVNKLIGREFTYDPPGGNFADFDPHKYHLFADLYWWYVRQDTFQSIIAGNRLLLKYSSWRHCPPRASVGKPSAIYGTHDHLILILGRIADFAARDRERKIKHMQANGGQWRPPHSGPRPSTLSPQHHQPPFPGSSNTSQTSTPSPSPPPFFGMAPLPTNVKMPPSYSDNAMTPPNASSSSSDDTSSDLAYLTEAAHAEWNQMYSALKELELHFGQGFQPLPTDVHPAMMTPFGEALHYASYDIGCLLALYYAAHIVALRCHPDMSPYVMVAAGYSAPQTAEFALKIGRIAAGMMPGELRNPLNPTVGATLCEVTVPLFIAGIQYREAAQRDWLVRRTRELEGLTGWASIGMIAQGCETAWRKSALAGRAPPYVPSAEASAVTTSWERIGPGGEKISDELRPPAAIDRKRRLYSNEPSDGNGDSLNRDHERIKTPRTTKDSGLKALWAEGLLGEYGDNELDK